MQPWKVQLDGSVQGGSHLPCLRALQCLFLCERRLRAAAKRIGRQPHGARHDRTNPTMNWAKHPTRPPRRASSLQSIAVFQPSRRVRGKLNGLNLIMIMIMTSIVRAQCTACGCGSFRCVVATACADDTCTLLPRVRTYARPMCADLRMCTWGPRVARASCRRAVR